MAKAAMIIQERNGKEESFRNTFLGRSTQAYEQHKRTGDECIKYWRDADMSTGRDEIKNSENLSQFCEDIHSQNKQKSNIYFIYLFKRGGWGVRDERIRKKYDESFTRHFKHDHVMDPIMRII